MYIHEAVSEALAKECCIARSSQLYCSIKPTDTDMCCILCAGGMEPAPRWNPQASDLLANDWVLLTGK